jgi:hypothetical protein
MACATPHSRTCILVLRAASSGVACPATIAVVLCTPHAGPVSATPKLHPYANTFTLSLRGYLRAPRSLNGSAGPHGRYSQGGSATGRVLSAASGEHPLGDLRRSRPIWCHHTLQLLTAFLPARTQPPQQQPAGGAPFGARDSMAAARRRHQRVRCRRHRLLCHSCE